MAKINKVKYSFEPSPSEDVVGYRLRLLNPGVNISELVDNGAFYDNSFSQIPAETDTDGRVRGELSGLDVTAGISGTVDLCITSIDEAKNESAPLVIEDVELDFDPPLAPEDGRIEF